jgi:hypothetical protein
MSRRNSTVNIASGIFLLLVFHILFCVAFLTFYTLLSLLANLLPVALPLSYEIWLLPILGIGITQLLYVIPACIHFHRRGYPDLVKGLVIGAVLSALLNGGCFLSIYGG